MHEEGLRADAVVRRAAGRSILAAERLTAKFEIGIGRCNPAQLDAIITVLIAEKGLVSKWSVTEIVGMRVMAVEIADIGIETANAQVESVRQRRRINIRFFDANLSFTVFVLSS